MTVYLVTGGQTPDPGERRNQSTEPFSTVRQRRDMRNVPTMWPLPDGALELTSFGSMKVLAQLIQAAAAWMRDGPAMQTTQDTQHGFGPAGVPFGASDTVTAESRRIRPAATALRHDAGERPAPQPGTSLSTNSPASSVCAPGAGTFSGGQ